MLFMLKKYKVYRHSFPNGKVYIGITKQTLAERKSSGYYHNSQMQNAIYEFGWKNIESEILFDNLTKKQALKIEAKLIKKYNTSNPEFGYNVIEVITC